MDLCLVYIVSSGGTCGLLNTVPRYPILLDIRTTMGV